MDEQTNVTPSSEDQTNQPAEANNTVTTGQREQNSIPYDRFAEVNTKYREAQTELETLRAAEAKRLEKERLALGQHEEVIAELRPQAERAAVLEATLQSYLDAELETTPDTFKAIIPEGLDVAAKLRMVQQARLQGLFNPPTAPVTDAGVQGGTVQKRDKPQPSDTAAALVQLAAEYGHNVDTSKVAAHEQRIAERRNQFIAKRKQQSNNEE